LAEPRNTDKNVLKIRIGHIGIVKRSRISRRYYACHTYCLGD